MIISALAIFALWAFGSSLAIAQQATPSAPRIIRVGVLDNFPPQYSLDENGEPTGFGVEVFKRIAARAGINVKYTIYTSGKELLDGLGAGDVDMLPNIGITPGRGAIADFTLPVETFQISIFVRQSTLDIQGVDDLVGRRVGVVRANMGERLMSKKENLILRSHENVEEALFGLLSGHVDALVFPEPIVKHVARDAGVLDRIKVVGKPLLEIKRAMAIHKNELELLAALNAAIPGFIRSDEYKEVYGTWYGKPPSIWTTRIVAGLSIGLIALVAGVMALWRFVSLTQVNRRLTQEATERKRAAVALKESEERLRSFMNSAPEHMWLCDEEMKLVDINPEGLMRLGLTREQALGRNIAELAPDIDETGRMEEYRRVIRTGDPITLEAVLDHPVTGRRHMEIRAFPVGTGVGAIAADTTERIQAEIAKDEFISTLSHELRTPLTSIMGSIGIILGMHKDELPPEVAEMLNLAQRNSDQLVRLINDLLDVQKIEAGKLELEFDAINVAEMVAYAISVNKGYAEKYGINMVVEEGIPTVEISGDWDRLIQVMSNLISNAVKFSPSGDAVIIDAKRLENGWVRIMVSDHGQGIPEAFQSQIFEKFSQADSSSSRGQEGTGLGLSISRAIIERHGGSIDFVSGQNQGATFFFDLPLGAPKGEVGGSQVDGY